ncbi:MAG: c-type cytochrome biogenesis protein CcmI [Burkholderiales bacterium RIFCSPHIGHO2_12_FULL_69_20]|nr:MAG: c-type cytochrome biogenesis protein CcmI [Burkholderiales bacterium RIFCSPHIGHO2_12_FULL_69_20]
MNDAISRLRQQLQQLKAQRDSGALSAQAYEAAKAPLERQLLDQVLDAPAPSPVAPPAPRPSTGLVGLLSVAVLVVAAVGYGFTGAPGTPSAGAPVAGGSGAADADGAGGAGQAGAPNAVDETQFAAMVEKLAQRLKDEPDNAEGWAMLARSYARLGRHADALPAFDKAVALQAGNAGLLADYADTLAVQNNRSLEGRPTQLIAQALALEPDNAKALALAGTAAFNRLDYPGAVRHWERLAQVAPPGSGFAQQLQDGIAEARAMGGMPPGQPIGSAQPARPGAAAPPAASAVAADGTASLRGSVRLSAAVAKLAAPTDTVFVFARAAEGPRMPLAILRYQVKDLPVDFKLDDSQAMSPATRLSAFPQVVISARVSKSGQATPSAGDLTGQSPPVANTARGVRVEISEVVKP